MVSQTNDTIWYHREYSVLMRKRAYHFLTYRFGEILIPLTTWLVITLPLWLSPFHPAVVAYFIIAFDLYFLYKAITTTFNASIAYRKIQLISKVPFAPRISKKNLDDVHHFIIIPNYKEPQYKIASTIDSIVANDYPHKNLYLVLAFEKREEEAKEKEQFFRDTYGKDFLDIIATYHELVPGEVPGKASNQTFAAKVIDTYTHDRGWDPKNCVITICDADSHFPTNYFSYMTYKFLRDPERAFHFYWAPVLLYNNFWELPFFVRIQATLSSIVRLAFIIEKEKLIQISTYSTNLWLLKQVNFWDVDIIPEDWHIYFQAFFHFGERVRTIPLYTIINGDAVYSGSIFKTLVNRYEQEMRWAWGVTDVAYTWNKLFTTPHIPLWAKLKKIFVVAETHFLWPTSFFILTISASLPPLINPEFKRTVLGYFLPEISGFILTFSSLLLIIYTYLDYHLRSKLKIQQKVHFLPLIIVQWYLLPIVSFVLSSLPALEAHTRLLFGKKITYKVTEKV